MSRSQRGIELSVNRPVAWQRSPFCDSKSCVEVASIDGEISIRDSKIEGGPVLRFTRDEWLAFSAAVKADAFVL